MKDFDTDELDLADDLPENEGKLTFLSRKHKASEWTDVWENAESELTRTGPLSVDALLREAAER